MEYEKKYPFARNQNEFVTLTWETGYRNVQIWFRERLVATIANPATIKKGFKITDEELNVIELTFSEKPMAIDVVIDGFHSPINFSYPSKVLKLSARTFWYIFGFAVLGTLINAGVSRLLMPANQIQFLFDVAFTVTYLIAAINTGKSKNLGIFSRNECVYFFYNSLYCSNRFIGRVKLRDIHEHLDANILRNISDALHSNSNQCSQARKICNCNKCGFIR